jgi:3-oxoacyl-[acyl-carrier protein] reductase
MKFLVSGTSRGVGKTIAAALLSGGHQVIGLARSSAPFNHPSYTHNEIDITNEMGVVSLFKSLPAFDVLINNAGVASMNSMLTSDLKTFKNIFNTNVHGAFLLSREAGKHFINHQIPGRIINLSTIATRLNLSGESGYIASKAALEKLTQLHSLELHSFNITVNSIGLTLFETDLTKGIPLGKKAKLRESLTIKEDAEIQDLIHIILFFSDRQSRFITGQHLNLGGVF